MKTLSVITGLLTILALMSAAHAAKVYKWVDEEGVTHYGEQAPTNKDFELISTSGAPASSKNKAKNTPAAVEASSEKENAKPLDFEEQKKLREQEAQVRKDNCENAKANLKTIEENARIRIMDDNGEYRYLSEEERQQQLERAKNIIATNCEAQS